MNQANTNWIRRFSHWVQKGQWRQSTERLEPYSLKSLLGPNIEADSLSDEPIPVVPVVDLIQSVLIFAPDKYAEAIHNLPAISSLRSHFPNARLYLLCAEEMKSVYAITGLCDEIVGFEPKKLSKIRAFYQVKALASQLSPSPFSAAIFLSTDPSYFGAFKRILADIKVHPRGQHFQSDSIYQVRLLARQKEHSHRALQMLDLVSPVTHSHPDSRDIRYPSFSWTEEDKEIRELLFDGWMPSNYLVIHPYAEPETRAYPLGYWEKILISLREKWGLPIVIVGEGEDPRFPTMEGIVQTQGRMKPSHIGYLLSRASAFLGNLNGSAHWAAALGVPTVVFFGGQSDPGEWAPLGRTLLLTTRLSCSPCYQPACSTYDVACLKNLTPERVLPNIDRFLTEQFKASPTVRPSNVAQDPQLVEMKVSLLP